MNHADTVFEALCYFRNVGAEPGTIRTYVWGREDQPHDAKADRAVLKQLEAAGMIFRVGKRWFLSSAAQSNARGPALAAEWRFEDAWLLLALLYIEGNEPTTLENVILVMDFINHAIPKPAELHGAINRLRSAGLIKIQRKRFAASQKATALFKKVEAGCPKHVLRQLEGLGRILTCPCCGVKLKAVRWKPFDEQDYLKSLANYMQVGQPSASRSAASKRSATKQSPGRR